MPSGIVLPGPVPADVGIVAALPIEVAPLIDRLKGVRRFRGPRSTVVEGELHGRVVALIVTGMGRKRAQAGADLLIAGHRPLLLLSAGYAGGLDPGLQRGEIVVPDRVVNVEGNAFDITTRPASAQGRRSGTLLTVDAVARTAAEKAELRRIHGADLVDMETSAVAAFAAERGTRFASIRVVSDDARGDLPREVLTITGETGGVRVGATFAAIWKRPAVVGDLLRMREQAMDASERLAAFLEETIRSLG
jgi:adenosylhomocysteine nucleosidase